MNVTPYHLFRVERDIHGLAGATGHITGHARLTGPFSGAERRRSLRMDVTTCTLFGARCHNHDIPAERPAGPAVPGPVTPEAAVPEDHTEYVASTLSRLGRMLEPRRDLDNTPLAGGPACIDLEDEVSYGREGEVWAVAEDGVASAGKLHQAGGLRR
jgi:hypothetical protein